MDWRFLSSSYKLLSSFNHFNRSPPDRSLAYPTSWIWTWETPSREHTSGILKFLQDCEIINKTCFSLWTLGNLLLSNTKLRVWPGVNILSAVESIPLWLAGSLREECFDRKELPNISSKKWNMLYISSMNSGHKRQHKRVSESLFNMTLYPVANPHGLGHCGLLCSESVLPTTAVVREEEEYLLKQVSIADGIQ